MHVMATVCDKIEPGEWHLAEAHLALGLGSGEQVVLGSNR